MFIHDAILEKITCGETEVPTDGFTAELAALKQLDSNNKYKLQDQFEVGASYCLLLNVYLVFSVVV